MNEVAITVYPLVTYDTVGKAKDAFLDVYFGDGGFSRPEAAKMAGIELETVEKWFLSPLFFDKLERRLQSISRRKGSIQETLLEESHNMMTANMVDLFLQTDSGNLILRPLNSLPRSLTGCIKKMRLLRHSINGVAGIEFTEALDIELYDKTKVMNIMGDYTDVRNTALRRADSGAPQMVGVSITMALPKKKEIIHGDNSERREVQHDSDSIGESEE